MTYEEAQQIVKRRPDVMIHYQEVKDLIILTAGTITHTLFPEDLELMDEADFMYEVAHTLRWAQLAKEKYVTTFH